MQLKSLNIKKTMKYADGNPGPGLGYAQKFGKLNQLQRFQLFPSYNSFVLPL